MNAFSRLVGGTVFALVLAGGLAAPAFAAKIDNKTPTTTTAAPAGDIDFGDDTSEWSNDGECDDPRFQGTGSAAETLDVDILKDATDCKAAYDAGTVTLVEGGDTPVANAEIDFGDDSSEWANDGECDDPRFQGTGSAAETLDADIRKDATDCKAAYDAGTVALVDGGDTPVANTEIDFGDNSSEWANDGECDDPRFQGTGSAAETLDADILKDAADCKAAYDAGTIALVDGGDAPVANAEIDYGDDTSEWANDGECDDPRFSGEGVAETLLDVDLGHDASDCRAAVAAGTASFTTGDLPVDVADIDYGDDTSEWNNDGECDDPRFAGEGVAETLLEVDQGHDATDCRAAVDAGTATFNGGLTTVDIDYGDDASEWSNDGECDDPRFSGTGVAGELMDVDMGHDATDCRAAVEAGTAVFNGGTVTPTAFDYGGDWSKWANDGECDDLRFTGEGVDKKLLMEDMQGDATDCKTLEAAGSISIKQVYTPEYAAGAPYDSAGIAFGDNTSSYADDDQCDDPRFEGPGTASTLLDGDLEHDSADCIAAYEAGTITLRDGV